MPYRNGTEENAKRKGEDKLCNILMPQTEEECSQKNAGVLADTGEIFQCKTTVEQLFCNGGNQAMSLT